LLWIITNGKFKFCAEYWKLQVAILLNWLLIAKTNKPMNIFWLTAMLQYSAETNIRFDCKGWVLLIVCLWIYLDIYHFDIEHNSFHLNTLCFIYFLFMCIMLSWIEYYFFAIKYFDLGYVRCH
jgi:hypothetical protein